MPTYALWNPCIHDDGGGCSFDVAPDDWSRLELGTPELMSAFLEALRVDAGAAEWTLAPFCSYYFCQNEAERHWMDRYPMVWRASARFAEGASLSPAPLPWGYLEAEGSDPTWARTDAWQWDRCPGVVIADFEAGSFPGLDALGLDLAGVQRTETRRFAQGIVQARFDLGPLEFPRDTERMEAFMAACRPLARSVNWQNTVHYVASTGQGIP
jgi:hypothetical protein